jgi:hypothetical protein
VSVLRVDSMKSPLHKIADASVICYAVIDERCRATGNCRHFVGGSLMEPARGLAVCQYAGESCYYLFYCNEDWACLTDTWHQTQEDAVQQAEFEYEGVSKNWVFVAP